MASQERPVIKLASPSRWAVRADLDNTLLGASLMFAGAAVWGSAVAIRDQLPGRPLGLTVPLSVPAGVVAGLGGRRGRTVADAGRGHRRSGGCPVPHPEPAARCSLRDDRRRVHRRNFDRAGDSTARIMVAGHSTGDRVQRGRLGRTDRSGPATLCHSPNPERRQFYHEDPIAALRPARRTGPARGTPYPQPPGLSHRTGLLAGTTEVSRTTRGGTSSHTEHNVRSGAQPMTASAEPGAHATAGTRALSHVGSHAM